MFMGPRGLTRRQAHEAALRAKAAQKLYEAALTSKYKPNAKSQEIIGLRSPTLTHITTDAVPGSLTQTTFDTTSRADSAQILLTNSTGSTKTIIAAWIRGMPVTRVSDIQSPFRIALGTDYSKEKRGHVGGFLHDKYVDYEAQARDGDITFETGNNFVISAVQVNTLADYYWKLNKTKKHIYTLNLVGFQSWYEPGEWYTLQIGGAGEEEYIDSTVECFDVRCSTTAGGGGWTSVSFREVEENWKFDSNEVARMVAAGGFNRRPHQNVVTVAAQYYPGYADYYCGATSQTEINDAISYANSIGGGIVHLSHGIFGITSSITMLQNVILEGEGAGTIITENASDIGCIVATGTESTSMTGVIVRDLCILRATSITNDTDCPIHFTYTNGALIFNTIVEKPWANGIVCDTCTNSRLINNTIDGKGATSTAGVYGIYMVAGATSIGNYISGNTIRNLRTSNEMNGILIQGTAYRYDGEVTNNQINGLTGTVSSYTCVGIKIQSDNTKANSNYITNCTNTATTSRTIGLFIATGSNNCQAIHNYCFNNGDDTGVANTNSNNYVDAGTGTLLDKSSWT